MGTLPRLKEYQLTPTRILGYYEDDRLMFAAKTRNGFTRAIRGQLFKRFRGLKTTICPFGQGGNFLGKAVKIAQTWEVM